MNLSAACQRTQVWSSNVWYIGCETTLPTRLEAKANDAGVDVRDGRGEVDDAAIHGGPRRGCVLRGGRARPFDRGFQPGGVPVDAAQAVTGAGP